MAPAETSPIRRVLLIGFMGSGKSSVGRALARQLGWSFRDFDAAVEAEVGQPVPRIFRERGEAFFREVEGRIGRRLLELDRVVLASGGGWPVRERRMERLPAGTLSVWLRISPEEAVERVRDGDGPERPLLAGPDPVGRARELLRARKPAYSKASLVLDSGSAPPEGLARIIVEHVRVSGDAAGVAGSDLD